MPPRIYQEPYLKQLPVAVYRRSDNIPAHSECLSHHHDWGQFHYAASGDMVLKIDGQQFMTPPHYGVWIPRGVIHSAVNVQEVHYLSLYVDTPFQEMLPGEWQVMMVSPLLRMLMEETLHLPQVYREDSADSRLMAVIIDQLTKAPRSQLWLPMSEEPELADMLKTLVHNPADPRNLATWSQRLCCSERTLARRFQRELGISYRQWRQRNTYLAAIRLLAQPVQISEIAWQLGYESVSVFIAMFQRQSGLSPTGFRTLHYRPESN